MDNHAYGQRGRLPGYTVKAETLKKKPEEYKRFEFETYQQYVYALVFLNLQTHHIPLLETMRNNFGEAVMVPLLVFYFLIMMPICVTQLFLGQYAQTGIIMVWRIVPLSYGIGVTMLLMCTLRVIIVSKTLSKYLYYLFLSFRSNMQWANCNFKEATVHCTSVANNISRNMRCCQTATVDGFCDQPNQLQYSALEYEVHAVDHANVASPWPGFSMSGIIGGMLLLLAVIWIVSFVVIRFKVNTLINGLSTIGRILLVLCIILLLIVVSGSNALSGIKQGLQMRLYHLKALKLWQGAFIGAIQCVQLSFGTTVIYGSFAPKNSSPFTTAMLICSLKILFLLGSAMMIRASYGNLQDQFNTKDMNCLQTNGWSIIFGLVPQYLTSLKMPWLYNCIYFSSLFSLDFVHMNLLWFSLVENVLDWRPKYRKYRTYILLGVAIVGFLFSIVLLSKSGVYLVALLNRKVLLVCNCAVVMLFAVMAFWVYGVATLEDDIHFTTGSRTPPFWTYCWYASPFLLMIGFVSSVKLLLLDETKSQSGAGVYYVLVPLLLSPIVVIAIYKCAMYVKDQNGWGVFKMDPDWGPRDKENKHQRRRFNPRKILRFKIDDPLRNRPHGLISDGRLTFENERLIHHRNLFLEHLLNSASSHESRHESRHSTDERK